MPDAFGISVDEEITTREALRQFRKPPSRFVENKVIDHIDPLARRFIGASSIVIMATRRTDGGVDQTPRGDPPGFVKVLNEKVLALPDRLGNNRVDAFENILHDSGVGLILMVPGHRETLRVSGQARIVRDMDLLASMEANGHVPDLAVLVHVNRLLSHCPKAFMRGRVWDPDHWPDSSGLPTAGEFLVAHGSLKEEVEAVDQIVMRDAQTRLY